MSIKEIPNKQTAEALVSMLLIGGQEAKTTGEGLTLRYAPPEKGGRQHTLWLGRKDSKAPTDRQERETCDALLLALREVSRQGGHVVTVYPERGRYRSTVSGQLCVTWSWQSAPPRQIFQLAEAEHNQAMRWIAAVRDREKLDQALLGTQAEEKQEAWL